MLPVKRILAFIAARKIAEINFSVASMAKSSQAGAIAVTHNKYTHVTSFGCSFAGAVMITLSCQLHTRNVLVFLIACVDAPNIET